MLLLATPIAHILTTSSVCSSAQLHWIVGLASHLSWWHPGKKVAVLEARVIGGGQSGKDTGEISTWNNHTYKRLESLYGAEKTTRIAASQKAALDFVESVVKEKRINCGFSRQDAFVFFDSPSVGPEFKALLNAGLQDTKEVSYCEQLMHNVKEACWALFA